MKRQVLFKGRIYHMYRITDDDGHNPMYIRIDLEQKKVSQSETGYPPFFDITHSVYVSDLLNKLQN